MGASQYKDYVLVMLFIKYVSDKYVGKTYASITVPEGASFGDMVALKGKATIGDDINKKIIEPLEKANKLSGMPDFNDDDKLGSGKEKVKTLTNLIAIFETKRFSDARYTVNVDEARLEALQQGHSFNETLTGRLSLHGKHVPVNANVKVTRLNDGSISVITIDPVLISAADFELVEGINKLRELAGLKSISYAVPVTFSVVFK